MAEDQKVQKWLLKSCLPLNTANNGNRLLICKESVAGVLNALLFFPLH